jgi:nitroreductase
VERFTSQKDLVFYNAPVLIIITGKKEDKWNKFNTGLAAQNMFLYAYSLGLGSCWIGFGNELNKSRDKMKELGIPNGNEILACLIFGYPNEKHSKKRAPPKILKWF